MIVIRRGLTLTELLVVLALMAGVMGLVLGAGRQSGARQARKFMEELSAAIVATQTRALNSETGAALILEPEIDSTGAPKLACRMVFAADIPPLINGTVVSGMPPANLGATAATPVVISLSNGDATDLTDGYMIRFSDSNGAVVSPWFMFSSLGGTSATVTFAAALNQTQANTMWPTVSPLNFSVARRPIKTGPAFDPIPGAGIDLSYSGVGNDRGLPNGVLSGTDSTYVMIDRSGKLAAVSMGTTAPIAPSSPLFLLVGSLVDIDANQTIYSDRSRWLSLTPFTGRVAVGSNIPLSGAATFQAMEACRVNVRLGGAP